MNVLFRIIKSSVAFYKILDAYVIFYMIKHWSLVLIQLDFISHHLFFSLTEMRKLIPITQQTSFIDCFLKKAKAILQHA